MTVQLYIYVCVCIICICITIKQNIQVRSLKLLVMKHSETFFLRFLTYSIPCTYKLSHYC